MNFKLSNILPVSRLKYYAAFTALLCVFSAAAENEIKNEFNPVQTGVTSLSIAPDARGASMGDIGAATDPDANSQFWNPSKYAFAYSQGSVALSYTPWLRKLVNDIFLANLAGYWKLGSNDNQAISASLRYFSLGEVNSESLGGVTETINPYEMAFDLGYSRKLSEKFSMGVVFRYIYSDLGFGGSGTNVQPSGASAFAADISGYFVTYPIIGQNECQFAWGWNISNIGTKVSPEGMEPAFLPTNLKLGASFTFPLADYHNLAINLDLNKLLVPNVRAAPTIPMMMAKSTKKHTQKHTPTGAICRPSQVSSNRLATHPAASKKSFAKSPIQSVQNTITTSSSSFAQATITKANLKETASTSASAPDSR